MLFEMYYLKGINVQNELDFQPLHLRRQKEPVIHENN